MTMTNDNLPKELFGFPVVEMPEADRVNPEIVFGDWDDFYDSARAMAGLPEFEITINHQMQKFIRLMYRYFPHEMNRPKYLPRRQRTTRRKGIAP